MGKEDTAVDVNRFEKLQGGGRALLTRWVRLRPQAKISMTKVNKKKWKVLQWSFEKGIQRGQLPQNSCLN